MKSYYGHCPEFQRNDTWGIHPEYQEMEQAYIEREMFMDWLHGNEIQGDFDIAKSKMKRPDLIFDMATLEYAFCTKSFKTIEQ